MKKPATKSVPPNLSAAVLNGGDAIDVGELNQANLELAQLETIDGGHARGSAEEEAHGLNNRGILLLKSGRHDDAITLFDKSIALDPEVAGTYLNRGLAYLLTRQNVRAAVDLDTALRLDPTLAQARTWRDKLISQGAREFSAALPLAVMRMEAGDFAEALSFADKAIACEPLLVLQQPGDGFAGQLRISQATAHVLKGEALQQLGRFQEAAEAFSAAIAVENNQGDVLFKRGLCLGFAGEFNPALESFRAAASLKAASETDQVTLFAIQNLFYLHEFIHYNHNVSEIEEKIRELAKLANIDEQVISRAVYSAQAQKIGHAETSTATSNSSVLTLPEAAPKLYAERDKGQSIIEFLRDPDGWGPYVRAGVLTRPDLRRLDPQGYTALANWLRSSPLPDDLNIPTRSDVVQAELANEGEARLLAAQRLLSARARRRRPSAG